MVCPRGHFPLPTTVHAETEAQGALMAAWCAAEMCASTKQPSTEQWVSAKGEGYATNPYKSPKHLCPKKPQTNLSLQPLHV